MSGVEKQPRVGARRIRGAAGGVTAFRQLRRTLFQRVRRRFFYLGRAQIEDAVSEAILSRWEKDAVFRRDVEEGRGESHVDALYPTACRSVGDSVREDKRRCQREREYARRKNAEVGEDCSVQNGRSAAGRSLAEQEEELERLLACCRAWEQAVVRLRWQGIEDVAAFAAVIPGVAQLPAEEQQRAVDREWDRIRMRLRRRAQRSRSRLKLNRYQCRKSLPAAVPG